MLRALEFLLGYPLVRPKSPTKNIRVLPDMGVPRSRDLDDDLEANLGSKSKKKLT